MGFTRKPCPSCGKVDHGRPPEGVCHQCTLDREELAKFRAERDAARSAPDTVAFRLSERACDVVRLAYAGTVTVNHERVWEAALHRVLALASTPVVGVLHQGAADFITRDGGWNVPVHQMPKALYAALLALHRADGACRNAAYEEGRRDGGSFIRRMVAGELTLAQIDRGDERTPR